MSEPTALSLIPPLVVLVLAIWLRRPILSLIIGAVTGFLLLDPSQVLNNFASVSLKVMADETIGWLILVCGGFGALIALLVRTGGALAFGRNALRFAKGPKSSLLMTFILGIVIFIDDYLNALTVGETMKRVTDKFKVSREMLAYVVDSTAAPVCVLVPLSTWAVFFGGLLVDNGVAAEGQGIAVYMQAIPYMLYAWLAVAMVLLVVLGIVPAIGPMKTAQLRAAQGEPAEAQVDFDQVQTSD
ncbi:MAG TPA: sodium:proton antiporter, partial [Shewanella baltica]|nr:sodium:proton antiporter [Shewanella baltica]